ncbi:MAG: metal ABC transporter permease [Anaerolineales bacterium]|jgi:zinc/manganese transport system permease protein
MLSLFHHGFVQNAFLAGTLVAVLSALIGYFVVLRAESFAGDALSHIGFSGATGAALVGASSLVGMLLFTLLGAIGMGSLGKRLRGRDVETGMLLAFVLGLGVLFLSLYTGTATKAVSVLFGSILSVSLSDVYVTLAGSLVAITALAILFRPLLFASIDPEVAEARGVPVRWLSILFLVLLAVTASEAIQVVGVLLAFALPVVPSAAAEHMTNRPGLAILLAVLISLLSTWGGLVLGFVGHWPVSFYIVSLTSVSYFISLAVGALRYPRRYREPPHPTQEVLPPAR